MAKFRTITALQYEDTFYEAGEVVSISKEKAEPLLKIEAIAPFEEVETEIVTEGIPVESAIALDEVEDRL